MDTAAGQAERAGRRRSPWHRLLTVLGVLLILAGVGVIAVPLYSVWHRGQSDQRALDDWAHGGSGAITGAVGDSHDPAAYGGAGGCRAATAPAGDYALVAFPSLSQYSYAAVAGDGSWDLLTQRSMVHYQGSAAPGQAGNAIVGFHREPGFQHVDELRVGDLVSVEDRACHRFSYRITQASRLRPDDVGPMLRLGGQESVLTLVTCTPWYVDSERLVWRGSLVVGG